MCYQAPPSPVRHHQSACEHGDTNGNDGPDNELTEEVK